MNCLNAHATAKKLYWPNTASLLPGSLANDNPRLRALGMYEGQIWMADDFDAPLSEDELKDWGL